MSHDDFAFEPIKGLPEIPPEGERILWQGSPDWKALAWRPFHIREVAFYFAVLIAAQPVLALARGDAAVATVPGMLWLTATAIVAIGILAGIAWLNARETVYTITSRRLVMRIGVALPVTINLPFAVVAGAGLRTWRDGIGDIPLDIAKGERVSYGLLWPHARPWHIGRPQPMLRGVPDAATIGDILARALAAHAGQPGALRMATPVAANDAGLPQGLAAAR